MVRTLGMIFVALVILVEDTSGMNSGFELRIIFFPDFIAVITLMNQRVQQSGTTESLIINRKLIMIIVQQTGAQTGIRYQYAIYRNHSSTR